MVSCARVCARVLSSPLSGSSGHGSQARCSDREGPAIQEEHGDTGHRLSDVNLRIDLSAYVKGKDDGSHLLPSRKIRYLQRCCSQCWGDVSVVF